jgi:hypothetical protein
MERETFNIIKCKCCGKNSYGKYKELNDGGCKHCQSKDFDFIGVSLTDRTKEE